MLDFSACGAKPVSLGPLASMLRIVVRVLLLVSLLIACCRTVRSELDATSRSDLNVLLRSQQLCVTALDFDRQPADISTEVAAELRLSGVAVWACSERTLPSSGLSLVLVDLTIGHTGCTHGPPPYVGPRYAIATISTQSNSLAERSVRWNLGNVRSSISARRRFVRELSRAYKAARRAG